MKRYRVTLTADERAQLDRRLARGKADVRKLRHAQILLKADEAAGGRRGDRVVFIRALLDGRYREAERVVLVMDQPNTHSPASLYEAFVPAEAKRLADRLEIHHTPKHGSWLNMAEIELSALARQCLARRIAHPDTLQRRIEQREGKRNAAGTPVRWQFTTDDARIKRRSLYPSGDG